MDRLLKKLIEKKEKFKHYNKKVINHNLANSLTQIYQSNQPKKK